MGAVRRVARGGAEDIPGAVLLDTIELAVAAVVAGGLGLVCHSVQH